MVKEFDDIEIENPLHKNQPNFDPPPIVNNPDIARLVLQLSNDVGEFVADWLEARSLIKEVGGRDTADIAVNAMGHTVGIMTREYCAAFKTDPNDVIKVISTQLAFGLRS